ncbi:DUF697 domain-containing protein [Acidocella facilis]|uniref:DUF697 domain-containing protein n=1 Tax=Acidocella facilis TaxID=525 RepID=UPI001F192553|nr:DUF697 domain-containing protein [Acidocella facilis]
MITKPRFLDEPEPVQPEPTPAPQEKPEETATSKLQAPKLLDYDPTGPDELSTPNAVEQLPEPVVGIPGFGIISAVGGLILAWFAIYAISFVIREYSVAHFLGYLAAVLVALSVAFIAVFVTREFLSWRALGEISRLRAILASPLSDRRDVFAAANEWLSLIPNNVTIPEDARKRIGLFETADEIRGYLKTKISPALDSLVEKYTKASILQMGAMAAISPKVFWDDVATVIRSFILIRQIAKVYGVRPSFSTTMVLLRHIMTTMATTTAAASLVNQAVEFGAKIHPMVENFAKTIGIGGAEATRIYQLAVMTAKSCNPLER